jgi:nicotinate phosphoribosyltransferase
MSNKNNKKNQRFSLSSGLWLDLYGLTMAQVYFYYKPQQRAVFELFIRSDKRPFYAVYGIQESLKQINRMRFSEQDLDYLRSLDLFKEEFLKYLKKFEFRGDVWAVDEPEIVFGQEPVLQVSGSMVEAQLMESSLLNIINLNTTLLTKSVRIVNAAKGRKVFDFSLRRTQGREASLAAAKASYVAGAAGTSNLLAGKLYDIPVVGTMAHSFVTGFVSELESFRAFTRMYPENTILLIDTYSTGQGIDNAIKLAQEIKKDRHKLLGIRIDSGDLVEEAKRARSRLDAAGFVDVVILASGDLDEYTIRDLIQKKAPIDAFGVGTRMGVSSDLPYSDVIYKMVETTDAWGNVIPVMKYSEDKSTLPFRKQVFRKSRAKKILKEDIITLASEKSAGKPLLKQVVRKGQLLVRDYDLEEHRRRLKEKFKNIPKEIKNVEKKVNSPVVLSCKIKKSKDQTIKFIEAHRQNKTKLFFDIDTQHDFVDKKGGLYVEGAHLLKNKWRHLTQQALKRGVFIISSQDLHKKRDPEFKNFPPHCLRGEKGSEKIFQTLAKIPKFLGSESVSADELYRIKEKYPQIVLEKTVLDVFSNPNTKKLIEVLRPEEVFVYGVATEFCVKLACLGLVDIVDKVYLVEDAVKEVSFKEKIKTFTQLRAKGVRFVKAEEVLKDS